MEKIFLPTDFSDEAGYALDLAYQLARKANAELHLLNVIEHPGGQSFSALGDSVPSDMRDNLYILQLIKKTKEDLAAIVNDEQYSDINITSDIKIGNPYKSITKSITDTNADLVVMGTKGASGIDEILIGSNAEKVVRYARCPVITVKQKINVTDISNIVFASSFTEDESHIIDQLKKLQKTFASKLHLLKVNTPNNFDKDATNKRLIREFAQKNTLENFTVNIYNDLTEEDGIIAFTHENEADMIAMATHGRTGFMHLLSGSIAEDVVNHTKRPVWTYNIDGRADH